MKLEGWVDFLMEMESFDAEDLAYALEGYAAYKLSEYLRSKIKNTEN